MLIIVRTSKYFVTQEIYHALLTCFSKQDYALDSDFGKKKITSQISNRFLWEKAIFDIHCQYKNITKLFTYLKLEKCIKQKCNQYCM